MDPRRRFEHSGHPLLGRIDGWSSPASSAIGAHELVRSGANRRSSRADVYLSHRAASIARAGISRPLAHAPYACRGHPSAKTPQPPRNKPRASQPDARRVSSFTSETDHFERRNFCGSTCLCPGGLAIYDVRAALAESPFAATSSSASPSPNYKTRQRPRRLGSEEPKPCFLWICL